MSDVSLQVDVEEGEIIAPATEELPAERELVEPGRHLPPLIRALRPVQWPKNLLVYAALIFSVNVFELRKFFDATGAFICFCAASSAIYLLNDIRDREQDAHHPVKQFRPIASGRVAPTTAMGMAVVLAVGSVLGAYLVDRQLALVVGVYLVLMAAYSFGLKSVVLLDVIMISIGFVLRAAAGAVAIDVPISPWLYICSMLLALLLGFGKRRHELLMLRDEASQHRTNLDAYSVPLLDQIIAVTSSSAVVAYSVYTFTSPALPENHSMMLTIPIVLYAVFRYLFLIYKEHLGGAPELLFIRDRPTQLAIVLWALLSVGILYWN
ncbi:MAG: decaprenyl-phosphate phosphoribosyltransferase [Thermomicrobiales bacterium]|nr:decaprenyl-phosphate phosphoribosyltransferase [Thermomicrobiales bacterium]MCO5221912.1 decaprenyl-phosphate phosphoribosyltransferase [Thermomicrobiales bacterium]